MSRAANYTIKGFLYQFNLTLLKILKSGDDAEITIEGIIEDIDIVDNGKIEAVQCKYHEMVDQFTLSTIYKPILQMMNHFNKNGPCNINYIIYIYINQPTEINQLSKENLEEILSSKDKKLNKYIKSIDRKTFDFNSFLKYFKIEVGESFENIVEQSKRQLLENMEDENDFDILIYPNAINEIANFSIKHEAKDRMITKKAFIKLLKDIKKTAITKWTLALNDKKNILSARKKQLKPNLDKNSRLRYFIISDNSLDENDFDEHIVTFISEYLDKFHSKPAHIHTPLFALDCDKTKFDDIKVRLFKKGIIFRDGFITSKYFDEKHFFAKPIIKDIAKNNIQREFSIRLMLYNSQKNILNNIHCDDLFIISSKNFPELDTKDISIEQIAVNKLLELKFIMGLSNVYE